MAHRETRRYIDFLDAVVAGYNAREHRMVGMSPDEAEIPENFSRVQRNLETYRASRLRKRKKPKFKRGDIVRTLLQKGRMARSYTQNFSNDTFFIHKVHVRLPIPTYTLKSVETGQVMEDRLYENELQLVQYGKQGYKIEKVLKTKRNKDGEKMLYVKWIDFNKPTWIRESDITETY